MMKFEEKIISLRKAKGLSQEELAEQLGGAVIIWIFYSSAVNKIEKLNEDMEDLE